MRVARGFMQSKHPYHLNVLSIFDSMLTRGLLFTTSMKMSISPAKRHTLNSTTVAPPPPSL